MKKLPALSLLLLAQLSVNALTITHSQVRGDQLPSNSNGTVFPESWREMDQFYPRYYQPSATIQVFLKNDSDTPLRSPQVKLNGKPVEELTTRPDYAGPVIWHRVNPEIIPSGGTAMVYIRLREAPRTAPVVTIGEQETTVPITSAPFRITSAACNESLDRLNIYLLKDASKDVRLEQAFINGIPVGIEQAVNTNFSFSGPAWIQLKLDKPFRHGQYFELKIKGGDKVSAVQLRALPSRFLLGMVGGSGPKYTDKLFNLAYILHSSPTFPENFKPESQIIWRPIPSEKRIIQAATQLPPDQFIYGNADEPDAHEPPGLPYMERCGINIMRQVEPVMRLQRLYDPVHPTSLMIDRTYAPHNWYTYGEVPDLPFNDCYSPTQFMGYDPHVVAQTVPFLLNAFAPRPVNLMLWACANTGHRVSRAPSPDENEMQVLYALGSGVKGIHYFVDWTSYPKKTEGGFFIGASRIKPLWNQLGRNNARIVRMEKFLTNSYPLPIAQSSNPPLLWSGSLMSGSTELLVFAVNRNVTVPGTDRLTFPYLRPIDGEITVTLPPWFKFRRAVSVAWDKTTPLNLTPHDSKLVIPVRNLRTGMAVVLSSNENIETELRLDEAKLNLLKASEALPPRTGAVIAQFSKPDRTIELSDSGKMELNFGRSETLKQLNRLDITNAELCQEPDRALVLYSDKADRKSRAEIILEFTAEKPVKNLKAEFQGENTPGYHANMTLELIPAKGKKVMDETFKPEWFSGANKREKLIAACDEPGNHFTIRIRLKTPNIVHSAEFAALARTLTLTWEKSGAQE